MQTSLPSRACSCPRDWSFEFTSASVPVALSDILLIDIVIASLTCDYSIWFYMASECLISTSLLFWHCAFLVNTVTTAIMYPCISHSYQKLDPVWFNVRNYSVRLNAKICFFFSLPFVSFSPLPVVYCIGFLFTLPDWQDYKWELHVEASNFS